MTDSAPQIIVVDTPAKLAAQAANEFRTRSHAAIKELGRFAIALSGGTTPEAMLELLATPEFADDIDWSRVHIFWGDERAVPPDDPNSNYGMANETLLSKVAIPQSNIHRMRGERDPGEAARKYDEELRAFFGRQTSFDLSFLGLGPDGHTASLFPNTPALVVRDRLCAANLVSENVASPWRITLTYPALNASLAVFFLVDGAAKADIVAAVINGPRDPQRLPAQGIVPTGRLTWLLDSGAASKLTT